MSAAWAANAWEQTGGPEGGAINQLAVAPNLPTTLYVGTEGGGVFKSTDAGATWVAVNNGLTRRYVASVAVDPTASTTVYAGTSGGGVFKSMDGGMNWVIASPAFAGAYVQSLAIDPALPTTLYAGTYGGVFKSVDGGANWAANNVGLTSTQVSAIAIDASSPATLYAGTSGGGVFKSVDGGANWAATGLTTGSVQALALDPAAPATLYAGGSAGASMMKSVDGGANWFAASSGLFSQTMSIAVDSAASSTLFAGTSGGLYKSLDAGLSWSALGPVGAQSYAVRSVAVQSSSIYMGAYGGVFTSADGGVHWSTANTGLKNSTVQALVIDPASPSTIYAGIHAGGIVKSNDAGMHWFTASTGITNTDMRALAVDPTTTTTLYAGTWGGGVFKSVNGGASWAPANSGMTTLTVLALVVTPATPAVLYAATNTGVFKSTNGGTAWLPASTGLPAGYVFSLAIDPTSPSTLYAGHNSGGIYKSTDGGASWTVSRSSGNILSLVIENSATLYAASQYEGLLKSTDGGASWSYIHTGLLGSPSALAIDSAAHPTLYAGTTEGVFKSVDGGAHWSAAKDGLANIAVYSLAVDPATPTTIYAGTLGSSVFKSTNGALSSESRLLDLIMEVGGGPVALSPAFNSATLTYTATVQGSGSATLTPTAWMNDAAIAVMGTAVASGAASGAIALNPGSNTLSVLVTSGDGTSTTTYTVAVTRQVIAPAVPTGVQAVLGVPGTGQATVNWTPSASSGSSALAGYTVAGGGSGCTAGPGDSSCMVSGLTNGTPYSFTVTAANAEGATATSSMASNTVTPQGTQTITFPSQAVVSRSYAPSGTFAIAPLASVTSGQPLTYGSQNAAVCTVLGTTVTMAGVGACVLTADQPGGVAWAAAPQATSTVAIGLGLNALNFPAQAARTFASGGTFAISPSATGLSSAAVTYASQTPGVCTVSGSTVTMVSAGTCTIAANQAGDALWGAAAQQTQNVAIGATAPGAPGDVRAQPVGGGQVTVTWTAPADTGGGITGYVVTALPGGQICTPTPATATTCTFTGLSNGQTYTFTVQAINGSGSTGSSAPSNPATPLADSKAFSASAPTGSGTVGVAVSGGGAACAFESVQLLSAASAGAPAGRSFPYGVLDFVLSGCDTSAVAVAVSYPDTLPADAQYWKRQGGTWGAFASAALGTNTAVLTLVDGGQGDDDGVQDGRIVDPGGVAVLAAPGPSGTAAIPTLSEWGGALLATILCMLAWTRRVAIKGAAIDE